MHLESQNLGGGNGERRITRASLRLTKRPCVKGTKRRVIETAILWLPYECIGTPIYIYVHLSHTDTLYLNTYMHTYKKLNPELECIWSIDFSVFMPASREEVKGAPLHVKDTGNFHVQVSHYPHHTRKAFKYMHTVV